jgi:toxin ParE1/3/4
VKPVIFHPLAESEYLAAVDYYEQQRRGLGLDLQAEVEQALAAIQQDPQRFPVYEEEDVRQYIIKRFPYSVVYAELEDRIWIAAVAHHKRKPGYWARRKPE